MQQRFLLHLLIALFVAAFVASPAALAQRTVTVALPTDAVTLDPHDTNDYISGMVNLHLYNRLVRMNSQGQIEPDLAMSWEVSADGLEWTFHLRRGVRFHDGTPVTAEVVKASFDRIRLDTSGKLRSSVYNFLCGVEVVDEYTVKLISCEAFGAFLPNISSVLNGGIVNPAAVERAGDRYSRNPVGTGPFRLVEWVPGDRIVLERNPDYYEPGVPTIDRLVFRIVPEAATRMIMLQTGEVDAIYPVQMTDIARLRSQPGVALRTGLKNQVLFLSLNQTYEPFKDVRVRLAINHAINLPLVIGRLYSGAATVPDSYVSSVTIGYSPTGTYQFDTDLAKRLLDEAGWVPGPDGIRYKNGQPLRFVAYVPRGRYPMDVELAQAIQGFLRAVGIDMQLNILETGVWLAERAKNVNEAGHHAFMFAWGPAANDIDWTTRSLFGSEFFPPDGWNLSFYSNPVVDELAALGMRLTDEAQRNEVYRQIQQIVYEDAVYVPLLNLQHVFATRSDLNNVGVFPQDVLDFSRVTR